MNLDAFLVRLLNVVLLCHLIVVDRHGELTRLHLDEIRRVFKHFLREQSLVLSEILHAKRRGHDDQAQRVSEDFTSEAILSLFQGLLASSM